MPENRLPTGQFRPGTTGNPGGRPKGIAARARQHTDKAVEVLVNGMDDDDARVRVAAAKEILDRGYGKSVAMTADLTKKLDAFDDEQLEAALGILDAIADRGGSGDHPVRADGETAH